MTQQALTWALAQPAGSRAAALADAYTSGTRRVQFEGRTVEYSSMDEIERALTALYFAASPQPRRRRAIGVSFR